MDKSLHVHQDFRGNQAKNLVLHHRIPAGGPYPIGVIAYDPITNRPWYSADGVNAIYIVSNTSAGYFSVGMPRPILRANSVGPFHYAQGGVLAYPTIGNVELHAHNVPNVFFTDPLLDARVDLFVFRHYKHRDGRSSQTSSQRRARWSHPTSWDGVVWEDDYRVANGIIPSVSMERGGQNTNIDTSEPRETSWRLFGRSNGDLILHPKAFMPERFFVPTRAETTYGGPNGSTFIQNSWVGVAGSGRQYNSWLQKKWSANHRLNLFFCFAYTWIDKSADDPRIRIIGPMSPKMRCGPESPFIIDQNTGYLIANNSNPQLKLSFC